MAGLFSACGKKADEKKNDLPAVPVTAQQTPAPVKAAQPVVPPDTLPGQRHVSVTTHCFGAEDPMLLDMMPRSVAEARRDTSLLQRINSREVFVVEPGEKGISIEENDDRVLVRFPDKIVWVMLSNIK